MGFGKKYFFITTNGNSASRWLAQTLNMHPEIICSHSPARIKTALAYDHAYSDNEFKTIMRDETRKKIPIDFLLNELEQIGNASCYGNVHLFNLRQLRANINKNGHSKKIRVVDLVRHPIPFVQSGTYNMVRQAQYNANRLSYLKNVYYRNREIYDDFSSIYKLDYNDLHTLSFMANVMALKSLSINMQIREVDHRIKMEDITTNKVEYQKLINIISDGKVCADERYLNEVFSIKAVNTHKVKMQPDEPKAIYNNWSDWQKNFFDLMVENTNIHNSYYNTFGYDFSFMQIV